MQCKVHPESQVFQKQSIKIIESSVLIRVWADAKFNNLVIYDREICMLRHTHVYYSLGHTLSSFQVHRAVFVSKSGTHCIRFELCVGFRSKFK